MTVRFDGLTVEIALGADLTAAPASWSWTDVSGFVRVRDGVRVRRGRSAEAESADPSRAVVTVDNRDGRWVPENPLSPWFGLLGEGTPLRVRYDDGVTVHERFAGFVSELPPSWDRSVTESTATVTAEGPTRRLNLHGRPLESAMVRAVPRALPVGPRAWWPLEDGRSSKVAGVGRIGASGEVTFDRPVSPGTAGSAVLRDATLTAPSGFSSQAFGNAWTIEAIVAFEDAAAEWTLTVVTPALDFGGGTWTIAAVRNGSQVDFTVTAPGATPNGSGSVPLGEWHLIRFQTHTTFEDWTLLVDGAVVDQKTSTESNHTPQALSVAGTCRVGHLVYWSTQNHASTLIPAGGHAGEEAAERIERLSDEEGIPADVAAGPSATMGPQSAGKVVTIFRDCEHADFGLLEDDGFGISYRTLDSLYNQDPALTVTAVHGLDPARDDSTVANDVEVRRDGGGSAVAADVDHQGRHGIYLVETSYNVADDRQLPHVAGWRLHLGTGPMLRWPRVGLKVHADADVLLAGWLPVTVGDRLDVVGLDALPGLVHEGTLELLVYGWEETITSTTWDVQVNCMPAQLWTVAEIGPDEGQSDPDAPVRLDTSGSELVSAVTDTATSLSVATTDGPVWTTDADDLPFDVKVGGEVVRVTAVSGTSSPQTFTVTRSVNGVVKAHDAGAAVRLAVPARLGL